MDNTTFILLIVSIYVVAVVLIIVVLNLISKKKRKKFEMEIKTLERDKNLIISAAILSELNKVEALINTDFMQEKYESWQERFNVIKDHDVPKITDRLLEIENQFADKKYRNLEKLIAKAELEIYHVKTKANFLLEEIKEITLSENRNRDTVTKLKAEYRQVLSTYNNNIEDYRILSGPLELQFENVDKFFSAFEIAMDKNSYEEVGKIVKGLDDMIGNLKIVIEEAPSIAMMGKDIIPTKIKDISSIALSMVKKGFNIDYLNIEYNINESKKKIADVFARLNVLNVEDSIFELKTMLDYFDSTYNDFDKERLAKKSFEEYHRSIIVRALKLEKINNELSKKILDLKYSYDLTDDEVNDIKHIKEDIKLIKADYEKIVELQRSKTMAYSKLNHEMELLNVRLSKLEDKLEVALRTLGSLKDDELRAREQLVEIKSILIDTKNKINSYKLPTVPKKYYIELSEATEAVTEINKELDKRPISIKILNTRVDTARDLALKLFATTNETIKTAWMAEQAIVYGNRYRPVNKEIDLGVTKAEEAFYRGNYKSALENAINAINVVEPGVHRRLIDAYQK